MPPYINLKKEVYRAPTEVQYLKPYWISRPKIWQTNLEVASKVIFRRKTNISFGSSGLGCKDPYPDRNAPMLEFCSFGLLYLILPIVVIRNADVGCWIFGGIFKWYELACFKWLLSQTKKISHRKLFVTCKLEICSRAPFGGTNIGFGICISVKPNECKST